MKINKKLYAIGLLLAAIVSVSVMVACSDDDDENNTAHYEDNDPYSTSGGLAAPTGLTAHNVGSSSSPSILLNWNPVQGAAAYNVYYSNTDGNYLYGGQIEQTSAYDNYPYDGANYYRVKAVSADGESSDFSNYAYVYVSSNSPTPDPNPDPQPSGQAPPAPTGLNIENYGSNNLPDLRLSWNASQGATSYEIYHSTSASYGYSLINTVYSTTATLPMPSNGNNYYKVKAKNSYGTSSYSSYVSYNYTAAYSPCNPNLTASISGSKCYLNWTFPNTSGCGRPTSIRVRVKGYNTNWVDLETLSGTATSYNFTYAGWVDGGYLYVGIIGENDQGSGSAMKVYMTSSGTWY